MVRPGRRKCLEEVYGSKLDSIHPVKSHAATGMAITNSTTMRTERNGITGGIGGGRAAGGANGIGLAMGIGGAAGAATTRKTEARTQRSFVTANDYYITTNLPITESNLRNASSATQGSNFSSAVQANPYGSPYNAMSSRRSTMLGKATARQHQSQQPKVPHFALPESSSKPQGTSSGMIKPKDQHRVHGGGHNKSMTQRPSYVAAAHNAVDTNTGTEFSDKELVLPAAGEGRTRRSHSHQHKHQHQHQNGHMQQAHPLQHQLHQQQQSNYAQGAHNHVHQKHMHTTAHPSNGQHSRQRQLNIQMPGHGSGMPVSKTQVTPATDDDKDEDPDEFFELIRQTVQTAIGSTISEVLRTNFRDLSHKLDLFTGELKQTNEHLNKLQDHVTSKVVHYGEENSRHFRYLCMKSEYDKMFYQHHTMLAGKPMLSEAGARQSQVTLTPQAQGIENPNGKPSSNFKYASKLAKHLNAQKLNKNNGNKETIDGIKVQNPCACHTTSKATIHQPQQQAADSQKTGSEESICLKTSELEMREVLGQIQRFCNKMQLGDVKEDDKLPYNLEDGMKPRTPVPPPSISSEESTLKPISSKSKPKDVDSDLETPVDSMDETYIEMNEFQYSSEDISSASDDDSDAKYQAGATTSRTTPLKAIRMTARSSHKGAGDGQ
ncbi:uncharacterized protein Dwil_GK12876 [Drosophila willistoni]|uniref:Uncharacterized protein n=1 Tax=Drosophila willistoni TaxID=7260 RepID=B4NJA0_DROWI|nr:uncharacterized protein LOC6650809 [Drosophila willistoni]EDW84931.1 uncharacterized protein Dwil_GK12876 [Drosophila willistoni]